MKILLKILPEGPCLPKGVENLAPPPPRKKNLHTLFTAPFLIATTWKQPRCPSVGEWINSTYRK